MVVILTLQVTSLVSCLRQVTQECQATARGGGGFRQVGVGAVWSVKHQCLQAVTSLREGKDRQGVVPQEDGSTVRLHRWGGLQTGAAVEGAGEDEVVESRRISYVDYLYPHISPAGS